MIYALQQQKALLALVKIKTKRRIKGEFPFPGAVLITICSCIISDLSFAVSFSMFSFKILSEVKFGLWHVSAPLHAAQPQDSSCPGYHLSCQPKYEVMQ